MKPKKYRNMKKNFIPVVLASALTVITPSGAIAQENADTIASKQLQEVVVKAPRVVHRPDMDVYYPSRSAVDNSRNGLQLLNNLMIPTMTVTEAMKTVKAAGQPVELRINGRISTVEQVMALLPSTIKRIEWIDNPGLRYNGAAYVLNIIVTNPEAGGSLQASAMPALTQAWGNYMADVKLNNGRSQLSIGGNLKLTDRLNTYRNYRETFTYPDGKSFTRNETSLGGKINNTFGDFNASYSYIKPDTTVFMVELSTNNKYDNLIRYDGLMSLSNGDDDILLTDTHGDKGYTPTLSAYLEHHLPQQQLLVVDLGGSFYSGKTFSDYIERLPGATDYISDVHTLIKDRNYSLAVEADYVKRWRNSRFTAGISYTANRNRSTYENLGGEVFHQRQDKVYFFAEYFHRYKAFSFTGGLGARYTDYLFRESQQGNSSWNLRPQATVTYRINDRHQLRLNFSSWQTTPSLAQSNAVPQQIDGFQWSVGNPDLKTSSSYQLSLRYNFSVPRVYGMFGVNAFTSPDAIAPYLYWHDDRLVTSYENSRGLKNISIYVAPQVEVIPDWLMLSAYVQYRAERMQGTDYRLYNHDWSGNVAIQLSHWGFVLTGQYNRAQHELFGEKISWGENMSIVQLEYNWKNWQFCAGMIMPFGRYDQGSKMLNRWNSNEQHLRADLRMPYVSISYNLQWGRQKRGASKLVNADTAVDTSTAAGR